MLRIQFGGSKARALRVAANCAIAVVVALLFVASPLAIAGDNTGWGVSAGVGASMIRDEDGSDTFQGNALGLAVDIEYRFTVNLALGVGGFSLGRAEDNFGGVDTEIQVRGYDLFGRVIYPVSDTVEVFGRVGAANYFVDIDPGSVSLSDALFGQDAFELGFGVDFGRKEHLALRLEGRYYNGGADETGALLLLGFNYLF
jgi:opacity protein-like surface antigen